MKLAKLFQNLIFYLPVYSDFRGRISTYSSFLSYQNADAFRSRMEFNNNSVVSDKNIDYLILYITSTFGVSRLTLKEKKAWIDEHINEIKALLGPMSNYPWDLIMNAKEPFQFIKATTTYAEYLNHLETNPSVPF
jgi:DNA-directed RNA polymerase